MKEKSKRETVKKGIILAGGSGSRLYPLSQVMSKQLQPVYDKPMIYYPLSTLMLGGVNEVLIISTPDDLPKFQDLLRDGSQWGIQLSYEKQERPEGIAQAFIIGERFIGNDHVILILGDNLFYGYYDFLRDALIKNTGATVFGYYVKNPERYGVVEFNQKGSAISIEEKPENPKSNYAVTGLYIYDEKVLEITKELKPSARGELEITDVNLEYLKRGELHVEIIGRGVAWLDTGTPESLLEAADFIATIERRQGLKFGCPEEAALRMGFIDDRKFVKIIDSIPNGTYKDYLETISKERVKTWELTRP
jgi:glucose-1-phosphate thymidylyltransferase